MTTDGKNRRGESESRRDAEGLSADFADFADVERGSFLGAFPPRSDDLFRFGGIGGPSTPVSKLHGVFICGICGICGQTNSDRQAPRSFVSSCLRVGFSSSVEASLRAESSTSLSMLRGISICGICEICGQTNSSRQAPHRRPGIDTTSLQRRTGENPDLPECFK